MQVYFKSWREVKWREVKWRLKVENFIKEYVSLILLLLTI
jgi:hypothetical protein